MNSLRHLVWLFALVLASTASWAGTQDFVLTNSTDIVIYEVYISETGKQSWEEDILGENVLHPGDQLTVRFSGRQSCNWDLLTVDENDTQVMWTGFDLCSTWTIDLR